MSVEEEEDDEEEVVVVLVVGETVPDQVDDVSRSARRHDCEQYAPPEVCLSQARQ